MTDIMRALRDEHANIVRLLDALERQLELFDHGGRPDYDIVRGIADYFLSYPDLYHHPKEDLLFRKLQARDPETAKRFGDLQAEHEKLAARTREFAAVVRDVLEEAEVPREAFDRWTRDFIDFQRQHLKKEEHIFFPAAERSLTDDDWAELLERMTDRDDPLFGAEVGKRYEVLRSDILGWEREAGQS